MWPADLEGIITRLNPVKPDACDGREGVLPFVVHEVIDKGGEAIGVGEYLLLGRYTDFNYGLAVSSALHNWDNKNLASLGDLHEGYGYGNLASHDVLAFIDNHDNQRYEKDHVLTHKEGPLYSMAVAFMLAWPYGQPRVMSSYAFDHNDQGPPGDAPMVYPAACSPTLNISWFNGGQPRANSSSGWVCEHRWPEIRAMAAFRSLTNTRAVGLVYREPNLLAFARLGVGYFAANNNGEGERSINVSTSLPPGQYCNMYTHKGSEERKWAECGEEGRVSVGVDGQVGRL